jgi:hypothetical protein
MEIDTRWSQQLSVHFLHALEFLSVEVSPAALGDLLYSRRPRYVNLDDCWQDPAGRDESGRLRADPKKFPSGMPVGCKISTDKEAKRLNLLKQAKKHI